MYRADLLLEILDSLLKTVSLLEIILGEVRRGSEDVWNTGSTSRHKVRKCLGLRAAGPGLARNRRREPGISKLQLLAVFRQSCTEDFSGHLYDRSMLNTAYLHQEAPRELGSSVSRCGGALYGTGSKKIGKYTGQSGGLTWKLEKK